MADDNGTLCQLSLYIHIPFCRSKCGYCDFNSFGGLSHLMPAYVDAVRKEMAAWSSLGRQRELPFPANGSEELNVGSIYLGGGTPTLIGGRAIATILSACQREFQIDAGAEITVEANPGALGEAVLHAMRGTGVNRLSMGAQSFNPRLLRLLGRTHSSRQTGEACRAARKAGFENVNLDLIYGIPTQTLSDWQEDLERAIALSPPHLSLYGLSVEEGTPLWADVASSRLPAPDPDLAADMYLWAGERLSGCGYTHYEISNWATSGRRCRHNLTYWRNQPYIGIGAGAHSSFCSLRLANVGDPLEYVARLTRSASTSPAQTEGKPARLVPLARHLTAIEEAVELDRPTQMAETAILNLRLAEGLDEEAFRRRFGVGAGAFFRPAIEEMSSLGLLERKGGAITLTSRGRLLGNEVFVRLIAGERQ